MICLTTHASDRRRIVVDALSHHAQQQELEWCIRLCADIVLCVSSADHACSGELSWVPEMEVTPASLPPARSTLCYLAGALH